MTSGTTPGTKIFDPSEPTQGTKLSHPHLPAGTKVGNQREPRPAGMGGFPPPLRGNQPGTGTDLDDLDLDDWRRGDPQDAYDEAGDLLAAIARLTPAWHSKAECRDTPTSWFFPTADATRTKLQTKRAAYQRRKAEWLCSICEVRDACLAEALADPALDYGLRGGMYAAARTKRRADDRHEDER